VNVNLRATRPSRGTRFTILKSGSGSGAPNARAVWRPVRHFGQQIRLTWQTTPVMKKEVSRASAAGTSFSLSHPWGGATTFTETACSETAAMITACARAMPAAVFLLIVALAKTRSR